MINKNNSISLMRSEALRTIKAIEELKNKKVEIDKKVKDNRITVEVANEQKADIDISISLLISEADKVIDKYKNDYIELIKDYYKLTGDKVHEDIKLLQSGYPITQEELNELGERHSNNKVMQGIFKKYGLDNNLNYYIKGASVEDKIKVMEILYSRLVSAIKEPSSYVGIEVMNDNYWEKYIGNYNTVIGDGTNIL